MASNNACDNKYLAVGCSIALNIHAGTTRLLSLLHVLLVAEAVEVSVARRKDVADFTLLTGKNKGSIDKEEEDDDDSDDDDDEVVEEGGGELISMAALEGEDEEGREGREARVGGERGECGGYKCASMSSESSCNVPYNTYIHTYIHTYIPYMHTYIHSTKCIHILRYLRTSSTQHRQQHRQHTSTNPLQYTVLLHTWNKE